MHFYSKSDFAALLCAAAGSGFTFPDLASNPFGHTRAPFAVALSGDRDHRYHASGKYTTPYKHTNP